MDFPGFRKTLNTVDLATYLGREFNLEEDIVARLIDEEIDGLALLQLTESDLRELGIRKMGTLKKILLLVRQNSGRESTSTKSNQQPEVFPSGERRQSHETNISNAVMEVMKRIGSNIQNQVSSSASMVCRDNPTPRSHTGQISSTTPTFPQIDIKPVIDLTTNIDEPIMNNPFPQARSLPTSKNMDYPNLAPPSYEHVTCENDRIKSPASTSRSVLGSPQSLKRPLILIESVPQKITKVKMNLPKLVKRNILVSQIGKTHRKSTHPQKHITKQNIVEIQTTPPFLNHTRESSPRVENIDSNISYNAASFRLPQPGNIETTSINFTSFPKVVEVKSLSDMGNFPYIVPNGATMQNIDLRKEIENKFPGGKVTVENLSREGTSNKQAHRKLVKYSVLILDKISQSMGHKKYYPHNKLKTEMAKAIIRCFPNLADRTSRKPPWHMFFYAFGRSGYIENRYKTLRRGLSQDDKAYKPRERVTRSLDLSNSLE